MQQSKCCALPLGEGPILIRSLAADYLRKDFPAVKGVCNYTSPYSGAMLFTRKIQGDDRFVKGILWHNV